MNHVFTSGDLCFLLSPVSCVRRRAIIFSLETGTPPADVTNLTWRQALTADLPQFARELVKAQPMHPRLQYVFWEYLGPGIATPLLNLEDTMIQACRRSFAGLKAAYDNMIWSDTYAEAHAFKKALEAASQ